MIAEGIRNFVESDGWYVTLIIAAGSIILALLIRLIVVQVTGTNEKTMEVRALISSNDSSKLWSLRVLVREKLIEFLQKEYPECLPLTRVNMTGKGETGNYA